MFYYTIRETFKPENFISLNTVIYKSCVYDYLKNYESHLHLNPDSFMPKLGVQLRRQWVPECAFYALMKVYCKSHINLNLRIIVCLHDPIALLLMVLMHVSKRCFRLAPQQVSTFGNFKIYWRQTRVWKWKKNLCIFFNRK